MARYLLMGDIHLSDRSPSSCTDSYNDDLFDLLGQTVTLAAGCAGVIWAGDVFHFKAPSRTSHDTVRRAIEIAKSYPCPLYVVPGNHDIANDRLASLGEGQPLGTLFASGAARMLDGTDEGGWTDDGDCFGVPWLRRFDDETITAALAPVNERDRPVPPGLLIVTHAPIFPPGQEPPFEHTPAAQWASAAWPGIHAAGDVGFYYGHIHDAHGIYRAAGATFCNPGAISRGSLTEANLTRVPAVAYWDNGVFDIVALDARPASEVFRIQQVAETKAASVALDDFLAAVGQTRLAAVSIEGVIEHLRTLGLPEDTFALARHLLEEAS